MNKKILEQISVQELDSVRFINLEDIPEPYREKFSAWLVGQGVPKIEGFADVAYVWDWQEWISTHSN